MEWKYKAEKDGNSQIKYHKIVLKYLNTVFQCVCVPVVYVVEPVQQRVDVSDLQLVVGDCLQSPSNRLVVALHVNLEGQRSRLKSVVIKVFMEALDEVRGSLQFVGN